jgi:hypothetical protein
MQFAENRLAFYALVYSIALSRVNMKKETAPIGAVSSFVSYSL